VKPVTEKTRKADDALREQLRHVDLAKLKKAIKPLVSKQAPPKSRRTIEYSD